jgi:hypothetical protein
MVLGIYGRFLKDQKSPEGYGKFQKGLCDLVYLGSQKVP